MADRESVPKRSRHVLRLELDQNSHIAIRPKVGTRHRTEDVQFMDVLLAAESADLLPIHGNAAHP
jgi:hypothetical protein